jgi:hypothetical protein
MVRAPVSKFGRHLAAAAAKILKIRPTGKAGREGQVIAPESLQGLGRALRIRNLGIAAKGRLVRRIVRCSTVESSRGRNVCKAPSVQPCRVGKQWQTFLIKSKYWLDAEKPRWRRRIT